MAEVQNCLGHRNKDVAPLTVTEQLLMVNAKTNHLADVILSTKENVMVQYMFKKYRKNVWTWAINHHFSIFTNHTISTTFTRISSGIYKPRTFSGTWRCIEFIIREVRRRWCSASLFWKIKYSSGKKCGGCYHINGHFVDNRAWLWILHHRRLRKSWYHCI